MNPIHHSIQFQRTIIFPALFCLSVNLSAKYVELNEGKVRNEQRNSWSHVTFASNSYICGDLLSLSHGISKSAISQQMDLLEVLENVSPLIWKDSWGLTEQLKPFSPDWRSLSNERWNVPESLRQVQLSLNITPDSNSTLLTAAIWHCLLVFCNFVILVSFSCRI